MGLPARGPFSLTCTCVPMRFLLSIGGLVATCLLVMGVPRTDSGVSAGTAVRMDVAELVEHSALVVEGRILTSLVFEHEEGRVETEYLLEVERTFLGEDLPYRTIRIPGGVLEDGRGMFLAGMPAIRDGEEVLLFLTSQSEGGMRMPVGLAQGKFGVVRRADGSKMLEREGRGVTLVDARSGRTSESSPLSHWDYADVVAEIEASLVRGR